MCCKEHQTSMKTWRTCYLCQVTVIIHIRATFKIKCVFVFQEELADSLSKLMHCFKKPQQSILFLDVFIQTESRDWFGIDRLRLDKFMMVRTLNNGNYKLTPVSNVLLYLGIVSIIFHFQSLLQLIRRSINQGFVVVKNTGWRKKTIKRLNDMYTKGLMSGTDTTIPDGLRFHMADIYLDELEKVGLNEVRRITFP